MQTIAIDLLRKHGKADLIGGLTVAVYLIPQAMAYAVLTGISPIYGLYTGFIAALVYPFFGSSYHMSVGPAAITSILVLTSVSAIAIPNTEEYLTLVVLVSIITGAILILMSLLRLGYLARLISRPVVLGFTNAAALIIISSQLKQIFGFESTGSGNFLFYINELFQERNNIFWLSTLIGFFGVLFITFLLKINKKIPSVLILVIIGIVITKLFKLDELGLNVIGSIPKGLPKFVIPQTNFQTILDLSLTSAILALIIFIQSFAVSKTLANSAKNYTIDPNKELLGLGFANLITGFFRGMPTAASFGRSALNYSSGSKSGWASIFASISLGLVVMFLTPFFYYLPYAILGAIIVAAVSRLIDFKEIKRVYLIDKFDGITCLITFFFCLLIDIRTGVIVGIFFALLFIGIKALISKNMGFKDLVIPSNSESYYSIENQSITIQKPISYMTSPNVIKSIKKELVSRSKNPIKSIVVNPHLLDSSAYQELLLLEHQQDGLEIICKPTINFKRETSSIS